MITNYRLIEAINTFSNKFDTHSVIFWLMQNYPKEYIEGLNNYINHSTPFQQFHANLGKQIKNISGIASDGKTKTSNVLGNISENEKWIKTF